MIFTRKSVTLAIGAFVAAFVLTGTLASSPQAKAAAGSIRYFELPDQVVLASATPCESE
jgi:hypothetical protein